MFSFFMCALHFKMSLSKAKHQHTDRIIKEKIEILGKLDCGVKAKQKQRSLAIQTGRVMDRLFTGGQRGMAL